MVCYKIANWYVRFFPLHYTDTYTRDTPWHGKNENTKTWRLFYRTTLLTWTMLFLFSRCCILPHLSHPHLCRISLTCSDRNGDKNPMTMRFVTLSIYPRWNVISCIRFHFRLVWHIFATKTFCFVLFMVSVYSNPNETKSKCRPVSQCIL